MGEYAEEAIQNGLCEMDRNYERYGTVAPGDPKYDNRYWRCSDGRVRSILEMNDFQIIYAIRWIENGPYNKLMSERKSLMYNELKRRGISKEDFTEVESHYWVDSNGRIQKIKDMDSHHLERVIHFIDGSKYAYKYKSRSENMKTELKRRGYSFQQ